MELVHGAGRSRDTNPPASAIEPASVQSGTDSRSHTPPPKPGTAYSPSDRKGDVPSPSKGLDDVNNDLKDADVTEVAVSQFEGVERNIFVRVSADGAHHEESIPCLCRYNHTTDPRSKACGESSDCINRLVQTECNPLTCPCGSYCLNRRFQKRQYANVCVINAGRKGFGLQALEDLDVGRFVMEYMGEVVTTTEFRKRSRVYQSEGIQHHYFMSIGHNKVIDATRKGCVARFVNHSCGPNCGLQKWTVGGAIRMGIFVERPIKRGEEITFDYKFERLAGADPQPCYCGSPECKGVIGVAKERPRKTLALNPGTEEEEAIDDTIADIDDEIADDTVTRHQRDDIRRRHAAVDDDEYGSDEEGYSGSGSEADEGDWGNRAGFKRIRRRNQKGLTSPEQVLKFVQIMHRSARETDIIQTLIGKLMETSDRRLLKALIGLQGASVLRLWLQDYENDDVMLIKILQCIDHMPFSTRNTIEESRLEEVVKPLCSFSDENVANLASGMVERWSQLQHVFKIPKKSRKESAANTPAASCRQSPNRANNTPPASTSNRPVGGGGGGESPGPTRWGHTNNPSRMRSASPSSQDASGYLSAQHAQASGGGWNRIRGAGVRGSSPSASSNAGRSPSRAAPYPSGHRSRYGSHVSRSRSPSSFHRTSSSHSRFQRPAAGDYPPSRPYANNLGNTHHESSSSYHSRGRYTSWNGHGYNRAGGYGEEAYSADTNRERVSSAEDAGHSRISGGRDSTVSSSGLHSEQQQQQQQQPPRLASGWRTAYSNNGMAYYYHESTKETRWDPPLATDSEPTVGSPMAVDSKRGGLGLGEVEGSSGPASTSSALGSRVASTSTPSAPAASVPGAERWTSVAASSRNGSRSYQPASVSASPVSAAAAAAAADDVKVNGVSKAKLDEIIERACRMGTRQAQGGGAAPTSSAMQLVTPDAEDEPVTKLARSSSVVDTKRLANGLSRRSSANSLSGVMASSAGGGAPAAKREKLEKKATSELAAFVVKAMAKYKGQLGHDDFKHEAKKITKVLMEKERKSSSFDPAKLIDLGQHKKAKIKQFVVDYMSKLVSRRSNVASPAADASVVVRTPPAPSERYTSAA
ncbi:hypothetical protein H4218_000163 [Coemansia sp. IMI 209128]|nr:hypothetical protein H4218_000163 [Coemansia sp. IMI 209128]